MSVMDLIEKSDHCRAGSRSVPRPFAERQERVYHYYHHLQILRLSLPFETLCGTLIGVVLKNLFLNFRWVVNEDGMSSEFQISLGSDPRPDRPFAHWP